MKLEDCTFDQLVDEAARTSMDKLLLEGGKGLRNALHMYMWAAIQWREVQDKIEKAKKPKK